MGGRDGTRESVAAMRDAQGSDGSMDPHRFLSLPVQKIVDNSVKNDMYVKHDLSLRE
jgi:hypothetical protein